MIAANALPRALLLMGLSTMFCTIAIFWIAFPGIVNWQITQILRIQPGNYVWGLWVDIKATILLKVYLFNITNHEDVLKGAIPKLQELGPYVYEEKRTKEIIKVDSERGTVLYKPTILHHFRPDLSNGTEEDPITMINVPLLTVANDLGQRAQLIRFFGRFYVSSFEEKAFMHTKVGTILFKGSTAPMVESLSELMGMELLANNTFAFFYDRNGTSPYSVEIDSGVSDRTQLGKILSWKGKPKLDIWDGPSCNMINGTDGTVFSPFVTKQQVIRIFEAELCRSLYLTFSREETRYGIPGYRFTPPSTIFGDENPDNKCFCMEKDKSRCPKPGVVYFGACRHGSSLFVSNPHFLDADPSYAEVYGLKPNRTLHESYLLVEPKTGVAIEGGRRAQINTHLKPSDAIDEYAEVADVMLPLLWIDEIASQADTQIFQLRYILTLPLVIVEYLKRGLLGLSCVVTVVGVIILVGRRSRKKTVVDRDHELCHSLFMDVTTPNFM